MNFEKNPNPTKDQHFMIDQDMLKLIYETANIKEGESILEIGGGSGALTDYLVQGNNSITVIEKDPYYAKLLKEKYKDYENVTIIEGDALNFSYKEYDRIVANLPYTITEPFLVNLAVNGCLEYNPNDSKASNLQSITLVVSQNSARKMVAPVQITEGNSRHVNSEFGLISVISKAFLDVDIVTAIPSEAFYPEPAVTSFVVNMTPKKNKTSVDRLLREMLIDRKGVRPSIQRVYQLVLAQEKVYKLSKYKNSITDNSNCKITSSTILNKNIYDLNNAQLSQLVQDLIRNDIRIKSKNNSNSRSNRFGCMNDVDKYFVDGKFVYNANEDFSDDDYEEETVEKMSKSKFAKKYDYMYDSTRYNVLLHRGLEYIEPVTLQEYLNGEILLEDEEKISERPMQKVKKR